MTISPTKEAHAAPAYDWLSVARHYLGGRRALLVLAVVAVGGGVALNWSWLVAAGLAPVLISVLPCLVMCGLGLCMNRSIGRSCATPSSQLPPEPGSQTTTLTVMHQAGDAAPTGSSNLR